jgi:fatty acid desaturase
MTAPRNYSLAGPEAARAAERGLAKARWYQTPLPRDHLAALMVRTDQPAIRDTLIWFAAFAITGTAGFLTWGTAWCIPCFAAYGILYGSSSDSRWHECGHRTAFRTSWMNNAIYHLACFMILREPDVWRWSHTRHHLDTIWLAVAEPRCRAKTKGSTWWYGLRKQCGCPPRLRIIAWHRERTSWSC